ncbi:MAG: 4-hydroxy-tetrahydrodipicolinate reductase [Thalassobaculum sp.]|uniref:4-hydroxy-tetrahydrodipicolinate reductase n=1 Tax=Thalassobaculum sp. TaxID=2022740 RepID=UPI0032EB7D1F
MVTRIGVFGANGRMGRMIVKAVAESPDAALSAAGVRAGSADLGADAGTLAGLPPTGLATTDRVAAVLAADVAIDFTLPEPTLAHAAAAAEAGTPFVTGTTGLSAEQEAGLARLAERIPLVYAPNMSVGVNLLLALVERVAGTLGEPWDIEIVEMHHNRMVDAPSGTAVGLGRAAAAGRGRRFEDVAVLSREGHTGPRVPGQIGFATMRGGDVIGEHTVVFAGPAERIEIGHRAGGRHIFANGAVAAARWAAGRAPGLYSMRDVLGL